jgi:hypothetical protein
VIYLDALGLILAVALVVAGVSALAARVRGTGSGSLAPPLPERTRWVPAHSGLRGVTVVVVRRVGEHSGRVYDERPVARVPDDAPDYDGLFLAAMALARERAALFTSEED